MAYQTYITEALVCGVFDSNTSDRSFLLFTKEAGMLYAHAKSVREERSKHRYALQECSYIRTTLVRGKSGWKIIGTEPILNLYTIPTTREGRTFLRNIVRLLKRVIQGETAHNEIFEDVVGVCRVSEKYDLERLECIVTLRVLHSLGYIAPTPPFSHLLHCVLEQDRVASLTDSDLDECKKVIEHAFMQSQL